MSPLFMTWVYCEPPSSLLLLEVSQSLPPAHSLQAYLLAAASLRITPSGCHGRDIALYPCSLIFECFCSACPALPPAAAQLHLLLRFAAGLDRFAPAEVSSVQAKPGALRRLPATCRNRIPPRPGCRRTDRGRRRMSPLPCRNPGRGL